VKDVKRVIGPFVRTPRLPHSVYWGKTGQGKG